QAPADLPEDLARDAVAAVGELGEAARGVARVGAQEVGVRRAELDQGGDEPELSGVALEAAAVAAAACAPLGLDGDVAELGGHAALAAIGALIDDDAAADAGAERVAEDVTRAARGAEARLAEDDGVGVV